MEPAEPREANQYGRRGEDDQDAERLAPETEAVMTTKRPFAALVACAAGALLGGCTYHSYPGPLRPRSRIAVVGAVGNTYVKEADGRPVPGGYTRVAVLPGPHLFKVKLSPYLNIFSPGKWATVRGDLQAGGRYTVDRSLDEVWLRETGSLKKLSRRVTGQEEGPTGTSAGPARPYRREAGASPGRRTWARVGRAKG